MMGRGGDPPWKLLPVRGDYFCLHINIREEVYGFLAADKPARAPSGRGHLPGAVSSWTRPR